MSAAAVDDGLTAGNFHSTRKWLFPVSNTAWLLSMTKPGLLAALAEARRKYESAQRPTSTEPGPTKVAVPCRFVHP